jgi:hypothetical protein
MDEIRGAILRQRRDIERLSEERLIKRDFEVNKRFLGSSIIKVIIGPRRAGKSVFAISMLNGEKFAYINFDDEELLKVSNYNEFLKHLTEIYGDFKFLLLDEVQNLSRWELFVNRLQRSGYNIVVTGSNSMLLSRELATHLTGRHIQIPILPFSFREFIRSKEIDYHSGKEILHEEQGKIIKALRDYLESGGFPEVVMKGLEPKPYLSTLVDSIMFKDVVKRYNVRFPASIYSLVRYVADIHSRELSSNSARKALGIGSVHTVENYLSYIEQAFLAFRVRKFSSKAKARMNAPSKVYVIDNGIINALAFKTSEDIGRLMENTVAGELLRRSELSSKFNIHYWRNEGQKEVDFLIKEGTRIKQMMQVTYASSKEEIKKQEVENLVAASKELRCSKLFVVTWDYEGKITVKGKRIIFTPLWKWLLS